MDGVTAESYRAILAVGQTARQINKGTTLPEHKTPSIHSRCICHTYPPVMQESGLPPFNCVDITRILILVPQAPSEDGEVLSLTDEQGRDTDGANMRFLSPG